ALAVSVTEPFALPVAGETVTNEAALDADHVFGEQSAGDTEMLTVFASPVTANERDVGETVNAQSLGLFLSIRTAAAAAPPPAIGRLYFNLLPPPAAAGGAPGGAPGAGAGCGVPWPEVATTSNFS